MSTVESYIQAVDTPMWAPVPVPVRVVLPFCAGVVAVLVLQQAVAWIRRRHGSDGASWGIPLPDWLVELLLGPLGAAVVPLAQLADKVGTTTAGGGGGGVIPGLLSENRDALQTPKDEEEQAGSGGGCGSASASASLRCSGPGGATSMAALDLSLPESVTGKAGFDQNGRLIRGPDCLVPRHIAVIMDGNRRFGRKKYGRNNPLQGHWTGGQVLINFIQWCMDYGVDVLTVYAFSTENWGRGAGEVSTLMAIFTKYAAEFRVEALKRNVQVRILSTGKSAVQCCAVQ